MVRALPLPLNSCRICGVERSRHAPCAVCFATNAHTKLCPSCKRDPVNRDWSTTPNWEAFGDEDDVAADDRHIQNRRLYELSVKPIKNEKPHVKAILQLFNGGQLSMRQIAAQVGRSKSFVEYVYRTRVRKLRKTWKKLQHGEE